MSSSSAVGKLGMAVTIVGIGVLGVLAIQHGGQKTTDPLAASVIPLATTLDQPVSQLTFDHGETSEALQPNTWNVILTPDDATILDGVKLSELLTPGKSLFGYEYTSHDAVTEFAEKKLHDQPGGQNINVVNLFPGKFFASARAMAHDSALAAFLQKHVSVHVEPLDNMTLQQNSRYVIETTDTGVSLTVRDAEPSCIPTAPTFSASMNIGNAYDIAVSGNYAYVLTPDSQSIHLSTLKILDISDTNNPTVISTTDLHIGAARIVIQGNNAYLATGRTSFEILNISDVHNPTVVGTYANNTGNTDQPLSASTVYGDIAFSGHYAYLPNGTHAFQVVDMSDPTHPTMVNGGIDFPNNGNNEYNFISRVAVVGTILYGWDPLYNGIHLFDLTDPVHPVWKGEWLSDWSVNTQNIIFNDHYAYVVKDYPGMEIVDLSDPTHPLKVATYSTDRPVVTGIPSGNGGFIDADSNGNPIEGTTAIADGYAYIFFNYYWTTGTPTNGKGEFLEIVDIHHPTRPFLVHAEVLDSNQVPALGYEALLAGQHIFTVDPSNFMSNTDTFSVGQLHCDPSSN